MKADGRGQKNNRITRNDSVIVYKLAANAKCKPYSTKEIIPFFAFVVKKKTAEISRLELVQTINFSKGGVILYVIFQNNH